MSGKTFDVVTEISNLREALKAKDLEIEYYKNKLEIVS